MIEQKGMWKNGQNKLLGDNASVAVIHGQNMTVCKYVINKTVQVPAHIHDYEQSISVLKGEMELIVEGKRITMRAGDVQFILGNTMHAANITKVPFETVETYSPVRSDIVILAN